MAYKLLDMAQARWRRLDGAHLLPLVPAFPSCWTPSTKAMPARTRTPCPCLRGDVRIPRRKAQPTACPLPDRAAALEQDPPCVRFPSSFGTAPGTTTIPAAGGKIGMVGRESDGRYVIESGGACLV